MQIQGIVNPPANLSVSDGLSPVALMGKAAELMVAELHAKYYTQAYRGVAFLGVTAPGGVALPAYNTTAQVFGLWNRAGNTRNAALQVLDAGIVAVGTGVVSNFALSQTQGAGSALATGQISAFTAGSATTIFGGNIGVTGGGNTVSFTPSAATSLASTFLMSLNYSYFSTAFLASPGPGLHYDFDEGVIVPPNVAVWLGGATVSNGGTWDVGIRWSEPPL
jgi:hypothetical protein